MYDKLKSLNFKYTFCCVFRRSSEDKAELDDTVNNDNSDMRNDVNDAKINQISNHDSGLCD